MVAAGRSPREILVASFVLASGVEVLFQLADVGDLRRGGVYLIASGGAPWAPRFDTIFLDIARKAPLARPVARLVKRAAAFARAAHPRLTPRVSARLASFIRSAEALGVKHPDTPGLPIDAVLLLLALIFVSEEERYPRPRYRGCDLALERTLERLGCGRAEPW